MRLRVAGRGVYAYTGARGFDASRPSVVFIHGAANDHSVWALQSRYFAYHGRNVLAIDLPGHGRSEGDPLPSVEAIADWIPAMMDAAGATAALLVGHSMGALASLECAARHPSRVAGIALLGAAVPMTVSDDLQAAASRNEHLAYELVNGWSFSARRQFGGNRIPGLWMAGNALRLIERSRPGALATDLAACSGYANGLPAAARVRCPALVVVGARDIMAPAKNAQGLIAALADVRTVTLPECGHAIMAEEPDAVLDALRAFVP